jgi:hypothetical protein
MRPDTTHKAQIYHGSPWCGVLVEIEAQGTGSGHNVKCDELSATSEPGLLKKQIHSPYYFKKVKYRGEIH